MIKWVAKDLSIPDRVTVFRIPWGFNILLAMVLTIGPHEWVNAELIYACGEFLFLLSHQALV